MLPEPVYLHRSTQLPYQEIYAFNSVPTVDHKFSQGDEPLKYSQLDLQTTLRYFEGEPNFCMALQSMKNFGRRSIWKD